MPTPTYDLIASNVLSSSASSVTFSSIPATYRDLILVIRGTSANSSYISLRFNSDSGNNYNFVTMTGTGSTTVSGATSNTNQLWLDDKANGQNGEYMGIVQIMDYSATDKHKTTLYRGGAGNEEVESSAGRWASTSAINSITLLDGGTFDSGYSFYLYGLVS